MENWNPKATGEIVEAVILTEFIKHGIPVLLPWGDNQRYDMVIEFNGFKRVQCKKGKIKNNVITFNVSSKNGRHSRVTKNYKGQIDYFAVYCFENNQCYLISIDLITTEHVFCMRLLPCKNNQTKLVNIAEDYKLENIIS